MSGPARLLTGGFDATCASTPSGSCSSPWVNVMSGAENGTVWEGYSLRVSVPDDRRFPRAVTSAIRSVFPTGQADLDRELSRTLAMLEEDDPDAFQAVLDRITDQSNALRTFTT